MERELIGIINEIRENKGEKKLEAIPTTSKLRQDIGFDSFDLAELTVKIESKYECDIFERGLIETFGEIIEKLKK